MTESMIERVAKAIWQAELVHHFNVTFEDLIESEKEQFLQYARAAIEVMREPTDRMLEAGWPHTADPCWKEDVARAWDAMINAALQWPAGSADMAGVPLARD